MRAVLSSVLFFLCMLACCSVMAEPVAINFASVPLPSFVKATYRVMLNRDYVMSPELLAQDRPISVSVKAIDSALLPQFIDTILIQHGVVSVFKDGVWMLSLRGDGQQGATPSAPGVPGLFSQAKAQLDPGLGIGPPPLPSEHIVFKPQNRKAEFLATVINAVFISKPAVLAGPALVISAPKDELGRIKALCDEIDSVASKVKLSATFVEYTRSDSSSLGVSVIADVLGLKLGVKVGDTSSGSLTLRTNRFQAVIDALASDGRFRQVSAPTAVVDDNEKSQLSFGESVPTIASTSVDRNGTPVQQVQYQQSGVLLSVAPSVLGSGRINVVLDGQVSSFSQTTTGVNGSPTLSKRQVQTSVTMSDGELLMIGGLNDTRSVASSSGFSFLPKTWRGRSESGSNTDLVLILSASVVPASGPDKIGAQN